MWLKVSGSTGLHPSTSFRGSFARGRIITRSLCLSSFCVFLSSKGRLFEHLSGGYSTAVCSFPCCSCV